MEPIALTLGQQFDIEQRSRDINSMSDVKQLQEMSKDLLLLQQRLPAHGQQPAHTRNNASLQLVDVLGSHEHELASAVRS